MQNLIFAAYADNIQDKCGSSTDMYLQNACCCLLSAKYHNPEDQVSLITNCEIPTSYRDLLTASGVEIWVKPFDSFFVDDKDAKWVLAFYKLCALKYVADKLCYDKVLLLDTDVVTIGSYRELWNEAEEYLLLHQVVHSFDNANETIMRCELKQILNLEGCIHWGGEFVCGKTETLKEALCIAEQLFVKMIETNVYTTRGDEFIWTAALKTFRVKSAVAYIDRCWTGKGYYFTSTHMYYPGLSALHLPDEKRRGMLRLYRLLAKRQQPNNDQIFKMMRMPGRTCAFTCYNILDLFCRIKRKLTN